jgi:L-arabinose isomerase
MIAYPERPGFPAREACRSGRVGVFAIGHEIYWPQFPGLKERLLRHYGHFVERLSREGTATILPAEGLVDNSRRAAEVGDQFAREQVDLLICFVATYAPSANVLPVVQRAQAPVVMVGLQPSSRMDYPRARTEIQLENDNVTSLPEIAGALVRANLQPADCIVGTLYEDERAWRRLREWCQIATVRHELRSARLGLMGHVYEGMLDTRCATFFKGCTSG